ncbi:hypothetical protein LQ938_03480 [Microbacterium sp. cx-55]|uniref:hypothetical protein n=1 Tax=Microbacterium sp. cx-55 TaxID=2875948 RepID=UPI001CBEB109|nr:hypothetical protein [Microbacterium sp. cx-55]MBZ4486952.1 hypothetical protein [Microbacterium sp. cx-55]UGB35871.1 hypothetical protein LQ938_03480 [Microbacterium sp. cx-55]
MSNIYGEGLSAAPTAQSSTPSGTVDTAKHEASELTDTAVHEAGNVVETSKSEVSTVAHEAVTQVKDLYSQTQRQLADQAATQQERIASGLHTVGDELSSLADGAESPGIGADLVRQASDRVSNVATWIGDRDPAALLEEVKSYARRKPGMFIGIAAVTGLVVGRLVRALGENAKDEHAAASETASAAPAPAPAAAPAPAPLDATPVYDQSRAAWAESTPTGGPRDDRSDTL